MDTTLNPQNDEQSFSLDNNSNKSELMQFFEKQVKDIYWAHKDLIRAIFESKD